MLYLCRTKFGITKKIIAICVVLGVLLHSFSQIVIVGTYYANKDFIAKNLCENRNKPKMHCHGKCYLKKKLDKDSKEHAPSSRNQKIEHVVDMFYSETTCNLKFTFHNEYVKNYIIYDDLLISSFPHAVFHPPTV